MFKLDDNLLIELGLGSLPATEKNRMLSHIYETLEMRVGMKLAQKMTNEQLDEFEAFINRNDEAGALKWLETNFPDYKQVVADELETLKGEIKTAAPQIVAASHQQALAQAQNPPQNPQVAAAPQPARAYPPQPQPQQYAAAQPIQPQQSQVPTQPQYAPTPAAPQPAPAPQYPPLPPQPAPVNPPAPQYQPAPVYNPAPTPAAPQPTPAPQLQYPAAPAIPPNPVGSASLPQDPPAPASY